MKTVGLTGGIGSGKSLVCTIIQSLGYPVYSADEAGRRLLNTNVVVRQKVTRLLGEEAYDGAIANRPYIASQVFQAKEKLDALNQIIHPAVKADFNSWKANQEQKGASICFRESAILFESNTHQDCDFIICVAAEDEIRIQRTTKRDSITRAQVLARMENQLPQTEVASKSDVVIENSGVKAVIPQVMSVLKRLDS